MSLKLFIDGLSSLLTGETKEQKELSDSLNSLGYCFCPKCMAVNDVTDKVCRACSTKLRVGSGMPR